jgi:type I restriction enzyme, S subunit
MNYRPYPKTKPSGVEWLGDVPEGWEVKPLKVIASFNDDVLSESYGEDEEIEYVDIGSVSLETGIERTETFRFGDAPSRARRRVRDGDVIASTVRTYLKEIAPVVAPPANLIVSTGFAVIRPRNGLDSHFAKFSLQSGYFVDEVISRSTGVSYPAINASEMAAISLALPPLPEQIQIAAFLDRECGKLDALQAKQERLIELLKEKRQALISHAVTKGLDPTAKLKPSGIEWLGDVPEHWVVARIKQKLRNRKGAIKTGPFGSHLKSSDMMEGSIKVYNQRSVIDADFSAGEFYITEQKFEELQSFEVEPLDLLVTTRGTIGRCAILPVGADKGILHPCLIRIQPSSELDRRYLQVLIEQSGLILEQLKLMSNATTIEVIYSDSLKEVYIPVPPHAEQRAIVAHLDEKCGKIDQLKAKAERGIELLKERRSALISAAVTGKIDVRDVAAVCNRQAQSSKRHGS